MPEQAIRFGVSDGVLLRAATWKCWSPANKDDIYLACREMKGAFKASLHQSGSWHIAYDKKFFDSAIHRDDLTEKGRYISQWPEPPELSPGIRLAFRVITSSAAVCGPLIGEPDFVSVPPPNEGRAIEFALVVIDPRVPITGWPGKNSMNTSFIGTYGLASGRKVWVVYREIDMPVLPAIQGDPKFYAGRTSSDLSSDNLKAIIIGDDPDGSKLIYDCKVRYEAKQS